MPDRFESAEFELKHLDAVHIQDRQIEREFFNHVRIIRCYGNGLRAINDTVVDTTDIGRFVLSGCYHSLFGVGIRNDDHIEIGRILCCQTATVDIYGQKTSTGILTVGNVVGDNKQFGGADRAALRSVDDRLAYCLVFGFDSRRLLSFHVSVVCFRVSGLCSSVFRQQFDQDASGHQCFQGLEHLGVKCSRFGSGHGAVTQVLSQAVHLRAVRSAEQRHGFVAQVIEDALQDIALCTGRDGVQQGRILFGQLHDRAGQLTVEVGAFELQQVGRGGVVQDLGQADGLELAQDLGGCPGHDARSSQQTSVFSLFANGNYRLGGLGEEGIDVGVAGLVQVAQVDDQVSFDHRQNGDDRAGSVSQFGAAVLSFYLNYGVAQGFESREDTVRRADLDLSAEVFVNKIEDVQLNSRRLVAQQGEESVELIRKFDVSGVQT